VVCGNFWHKDWPQAEGVFVFLDFIGLIKKKEEFLIKLD
jgi:hypothetical protein